MMESPDTSLQSLFGGVKRKNPLEMFMWPYMYQNPFGDPFSFPYTGLDMGGGTPFGGALTGGESSFYPQAQTQIQPTQPKTSPWGSLLELGVKALAQNALPQPAIPQSRAVFSVDEGMAELPISAGGGQSTVTPDIFMELLKQTEQPIPWMQPEPSRAVFDVFEGMAEPKPSPGSSLGGAGDIASSFIPTLLRMGMSEAGVPGPVAGMAGSTIATVLPSLFGKTVNMGSALTNLGMFGATPGTGLMGDAGGGASVGGGLGTMAGALAGQGYGPVGGLIGSVLGGFAEGLGLLPSPQRYSEGQVAQYQNLSNISNQRLGELRQTFPGLSEQELYNKVSEMGYTPQWTQQIISSEKPDEGMSIGEFAPLIGAFTPQEYSAWQEMQWPGISTLGYGSTQESP